MGDCDFGGAAAGDEGAFFDEAADDAEGVVEGTFGFVEDEGVGAAADDGDGLLPRGGGFVGGDAGDFDGAGAGGGDFFDEGGGAEFVFGEVFDVGYWFAAGALDSFSQSGALVFFL